MIGKDVNAKGVEILHIRDKSGGLDLALPKSRAGKIRLIYELLEESGIVLTFVD